MSKHQCSQIESWLSENGVSSIYDLLYWRSQYVCKGSYFHDKCENKGANQYSDLDHLLLHIWWIC